MNSIQFSIKFQFDSKWFKSNIRYPNFFDNISNNMQKATLVIFLYCLVMSVKNNPQKIINFKQIMKKIYNISIIYTK